MVVYMLDFLRHVHCHVLTEGTYEFDDAIRFAGSQLGHVDRVTVCHGINYGDQFCTLSLTALLMSHHAG
jgi:hypothetical protein